MINKTKEAAQSNSDNRGVWNISQINNVREEVGSVMFQLIKDAPKAVKSKGAVSPKLLAIENRIPDLIFLEAIGSNI